MIEITTNNLVNDYIIESNDVLSINTSLLVNTLSKTFIDFIENKSISLHPSVFLSGQPGVGKSQSILEIAHNIEKKTLKKVNIVDIRLLMFNPVDLRGIPIADKDKLTAIWLKPKIIDLDNSDSIVNILFLDELTSAPQSLQAVAYQIALDRKVGEHYLPNNTFIIAAGNNPEDNAVTYDMPSPLKNRFIHFNLIVNSSTWVAWAKKNNLNSKVIDFIERHPDLLSSSEFDSSKPIHVTPRSWETLSTLLNTLDKTNHDNELIIASVVGKSIAKLMLDRDDSPYKFQNIINGTIVEAPFKLDDIQQLTRVLENKIHLFVEDKFKINNVLEFLLKIPIDYGLRIFRKIIHQEIQTYKIHELHSYNEYINRLSDYEN